MKSLCAFLIVSLMVIISGCFYPRIDGKVIDGATGQPLESAIVVAQWRKTRGIPGLQYSDMHKSVETLTDKAGKFALSGAFAFLLEPPRMLIYKAGYIPWRNDSVFPGGHLSKDNEWNNGEIYRLDSLSEIYTYRQLNFFMSYGIKVSGGRETPLFDDVMQDISKQEIIEFYKNKKDKNVN